VEELFRYILLLAVAYLFGSFPSAYLLIKLKTKKDIRTLGSGNVGALNALRSGKSKTIALIVLVLDLLKGALPAWYLAHVQQADFLIQVTVVSGVLLGHVYPVWLRFKGGRGLAVVAGALLVIQPVLVGIWLGFWLIFYLLIYKHIVASLIATFILPLVAVPLLDGRINAQSQLALIIAALFCFNLIRGIASTAWFPWHPTKPRQ